MKIVVTVDKLTESFSVKTPDNYTRTWLVELVSKWAQATAVKLVIEKLESDK